MGYDGAMNGNNILLPQDIDEVTNNFAGIYLFYLRFPSDYELGVHNLNNLDKIKNNLTQALFLFHKINSMLPLDGSISDIRGAHICNEYIVHAKPKEFELEVIEGLLKSVKSLDEFLEFSFTMRKILVNNNPIYVGMTRKQSIQERVKQHISGGTDFSQKISEMDLRWENISLSYSVLTVKKNIRDIEKLAQALLKPTYSKL